MWSVFVFGLWSFFLGGSQSESLNIFFALSMLLLFFFWNHVWFKLFPLYSKLCVGFGTYQLDGFFFSYSVCCLLLLYCDLLRRTSVSVFLFFFFTQSLSLSFSFVLLTLYSLLGLSIFSLKCASVSLKNNVVMQWPSTKKKMRIISFVMPFKIVRIEKIRSF